VSRTHPPLAERCGDSRAENGRALRRVFHSLNLAGGVTDLLGNRAARLGERLDGDLAGRLLPGLFVRTVGRRHPGVTGRRGPVGSAGGGGRLRLRKFMGASGAGDQSEAGDQDRTPASREDVAPRRGQIQVTGMYRLASARSPSASKGRSCVAAAGADGVSLASYAAINASADFRSIALKLGAGTPTAA
jgi:hypothetical protein